MSAATSSFVVPVVLFAYARPETLARTLECLRRDSVPRIIAFSDAPRTKDQAPAVATVRSMLRAVDWCDLELIERAENLGLGRSILTGMTEVFERHPAALVFEDDLVCVPGTYRYLSEALRAYEGELNVRSVTGWTHPRVTPVGVGDQPYFDGRAECWVWGAWSRSWRGMQRTASEMVASCAERRIDPGRYGSDLLEMAATELERNIWAVRFLMLHILEGALCLRPPRSLVEHIGWGHLATNAADDTGWSNAPLRRCPPIPAPWPPPTENSGCVALWQAAFPPPAKASWVRHFLTILRAALSSPASDRRLK